MADNKFNLNARIYQGYDPNTEFKENGHLLSAARFADNSSDKEESLLDSLKSSVANVANFFEGLLPGNGNASEINSNTELPFSPNSGSSFQMNTAGSAYQDTLSGGSAGGETPDNFSGLQSSGAGGAGNISNRSIAAPQNPDGGTPNTPNTPEDNPMLTPQLIAPNVVATGSTTNEGDPIPLAISITTDPKPGVVTTITITGVPSDATLSAGILNPNGTWTLTPAELTGLILTPEPHSSGEITLSITAVSSLDGMYASDTENFKLTIEGDASTPVLSVQNSFGAEDMSVALHISSNLTDNDGSELLSVTISNVPNTATLSAGVKNPDGTWTLTPAQLTNLTLTPPHDYSGTLALTVSATSTENGTSSTVSQPLNVTIVGIADQPNLALSAATGTENTNITLPITASLNDTDGSETLTVMIYNVPTGASLSAGTQNSDGSWTVTSAQLTNLQLIPPANYSGNFVLDIVAVSREGNTSAYADGQMSVTIAGTATAPSLTTSPASGNEDTSVSLTINSSLADNDGSETLTLAISGVPTGATLSAGTNNGGGNWSLTPAQLANLSITPPLNYSGTFNLTVTATSHENGTTSNTVSTLPVTIGGVPDLPTLSVQTASGSEGSPIALNISAALTDTDGSETLSVTITGVPTGATLSAGTNNGGGNWTLTPAQLTNLQLNPPANYSGNFNLGVIATASENGQSISTGSSSLGVSVSGTATTPNLSTSPASGNEDTAISLNINSSLVDNDGSETLSVTITGVPTGAMLSAGTNNGGGSWTLTPAQLTNLSITPPLNYSGNFNLTVTATSSENGTTSNAISTLPVTVSGVPDLPTLTVHTANGNEGMPIALDISAALTDTDGSETLSISVTGVPAGASLSAGTNNGGGSWTLTAAQLTNLQLNPPANFNGNFNLSVVATASENGQSISTSATNMSVMVSAVAEAPILSVQAASGNEDTNIALTIHADPYDPMGSEVLTITISDLPPGATLSAGTNNGDGSWTLTPAQLTNLQLIPAANYSGNFDLQVVVTSVDGSDSAQVGAPLHVNIAGVPDMPTLSVQNATGNEGAAIALNITSALTDTDGSETLAITITGVPTGATLSAGTNNGGGTWTLTSAQLTNLTLTPPANYSGNFSLGVVATASENNQSISTASSSLGVTVNGVATAPNLNVHAVSGNEDTAIPLGITASLVDNDGSETLSITITGVPTGATLSAGTNNGGGSWTLTPAQLTNLNINPPANYSGSFNLTVTATSHENSTVSNTIGTLPVTVAGVPDMPTLSVQNATGNEGAAIALNITSALTDTDGSETLAITITGVPTGATLSAGTNNGGGNWTLTQVQLTNLTLTAPAHYSGNFNLGVIATASENGQSISTNSSTLGVTINAVATTPNLSVHAISGNEDTATPLGITASLVDNDGSETLSLTITGVPTGATLSAGTNNGGGSWTVTPAQLTNLTITPPLNFSGSFNLVVTATATEGAQTAQATGNIPVTIHGIADTPTLSVVSATGAEDSAINLAITAGLTDTDGSEALSIVVSGVPTGAFLSAGLNNGDGTWTLSPSQLAGLKITPPANFAGIIAMQVTAISTETTGGDHASLTAPVTITVTPVADAPTLSVVAATGREDTAIALSISALLNDKDGSETLSVTITGVPAGASLSNGTNNGGGSWTLTAAQLANLKITPPLNSDDDFILNVTAKSTDSNGLTSSVISNLPVTVTASADVPTVTATNTVGAKNTAVAVNINGAVTDTDGSETITYLISGVPDGFSLNHGTNNGNNSWTLTTSDLSGLKLVSPYDFEGRVNLVARSVSHDHDGETAQSLPANFNVGIGNASGGIQLNLNLGLGVGGIGVGTSLGVDVNLGGLLSPGGIVVHEDSIFPFADAGLLLTLASSISFLNFNGLPVGASLSNGTDMGNGSWKLLPGDLANLSLRLPANSDQDFTLTITAKLLVLTVTLATVDVHVLGVADTPTLSVANAIGNEDAASIPISVTSALTDTDGSETLSFMIKDLPTGFTPVVGIHNGDGTWSLTASEISSLALKPPANFSGDATFTIVAVSTEREGDSTIQTATGHIHVNPVADAPIITAVSHSGTEDTPLALNLGIALSDTDGSESISAVTISGLGAGFSLTGATDNGNGTWSVNPAQVNNVSLVAPAHWSGDTSFTVTATSREGASGPTASTSATINAHIEAVADAPHLTAHDVTGIGNHQINLDLSASLTDTDGSEHLSVVISNVPDHFVFSSGLNNGDGSWSFNESQLNNLKVTPEDNFSGDVHMQIDVFAEDSNHTIATTHADFTVHVTPDT